MSDEEKVQRLHRRMISSTRAVAVGLALLGLFRWHTAGVGQVEWNSIHVCCAATALLALHPHAKAVSARTERIEDS